MRIIKRCFPLLISLILIFGLCACSEIDPNYGVSESSNTSSTAEPDTDETEDAKIISSDRVMSTFFDISLFDEENYSEIYLGKKFEIDGVYGGKNLPCLFQCRKISVNRSKAYVWNQFPSFVIYPIGGGVGMGRRYNTQNRLTLS